MQPDVSIIIVSMDRPDLLYPCLESIKAHTRCSYEVLLTAYRFQADHLAALRRDWPEIRIFENTSLAGFAENNNLALRHACGRFCFVVNDDTLMNAPVIDTLLGDFAKLPDRVAAISPKIVLGDGTLQTCGRAPWGPCRYLRHYLHLVDETKPGRWNRPSGLVRTWTLNGACFLIRTDVFQSVGFFDETYTFTPEDIALGHLLNASGWEVWADADIAITHLAGATAGQMDTAIKPTRVRGSLIFYSSLRHLGNPQGTDAVNRATYLLMGIFIWCYEALRLLRWLPANRKDPRSHASIMNRTARNVMKNIFTRKSTKRIFTDLYKEVVR